jgi:hypothetical protein
MSHPGSTDQQLAALDVAELIADGLRSAGGAPRWFGDGAVAAAIQADRLEVLPRSLTFLAEIVRRGGVAYATELPEPLPTAEQSALVREWLVAAAEGDDIVVARWLDAVAVILGARHQARLR